MQSSSAIFQQFPRQCTDSKTVSRLKPRNQLNVSHISKPSPQRNISLQAAAQDLGKSARVGVIIVDHGSRREASNDLLLDFVEMYQKQTGRDIVEPAHMELAKPSISDAFEACVSRGADTVVISPYFLSPGRHWKQDIPTLASEAASQHPDVSYLVTAPIGIHPLVAEVIDERIQHCLDHVSGKTSRCTVCESEDKSCRLK
mmetsp:Transcript_37226/g.44993  ORF Transcript_37226/g.44993 Transcript_37226/m.44993 type:complete len:201 (-) Transcript_37226:349-951(-)|eukprot:CAMPEP_0197853224 /NCGR_PEP_ID=MMETSP1438-20131217/22334_1 /TAXON_ID=1461541 /ORGANISM="Pterosperma sp., Strain CCMP1384" /LENGTH=200 /DNA_ID=CAMNT_0043467553 /DNA_START=185 /DNA_END=787 /DNA_ORIENTATION=+